MSTGQSRPSDIRAALVYEPETGRMFRCSGGELKAKNANGYLRGRVFGKLFYVHRLAFVCMTGRWPANCVDHIDGNRSNNAWVNLREATNSENLQNYTASARGASGFKNVYRNKGLWQVKIMTNGRSRSFGYFKDINEAADSAARAKALVHPFYNATP